ncbi:hypothetical protein [Streptomyces sp. T21Q-yed]|uniref:hypothetical protein n=1 Tax=Streptomyces sp. T21Q-yed TaxID=3018441 RepID=UPI0023DF03E3|nr:hypothetical protein [Streptomyces sp. T21Q-yed]MDF3145586.1 hypothetical protein [Streptomyces sp. T21Q-yed]
MGWGDMQQGHMWQEHIQQEHIQQEHIQQEHIQQEHIQQEHIQQEHRPDGSTTVFAELNTAAAIAAAQLPAAWLLWWVVEVTGSDDYGIGYGGAFGLVCLFLFVPLILPVLGLLHAAAHIGPAGVLARLAAGRLRGPRWAWHLLCATAVGAVWAVLTAVLWGWPFLRTAAALAALGVLPVLGLAYGRGRARATGRVWGAWGVWLRSALLSAALFMLVIVVAVPATVTGLIEEYEPPKLSAERLAGVWRGEDGAVLRLHTGGRAEVSKLPAQAESGDWYPDPIDVCDGTGNWSPGEHSGRDGVLVRLDGGCGRDTYWTIGGTEQEPELFVLFGDPDAGDLRILKRPS